MAVQLVYSGFKTCLVPGTWSCSVQNTSRITIVVAVHVEKKRGRGVMTYAQAFPQFGLWHHVPVTKGSHRHDGPPEARRDRVETPVV